MSSLKFCRGAKEEDDSQITERLRSDNGHTDYSDLHRYGRFARNYISHTDITEITDIGYGKSIRLDGRHKDFKR